MMVIESRSTVSHCLENWLYIVLMDLSYDRLGEKKFARHSEIYYTVLDIE
jgi:hypothetical protein